MSTVIKCAPDEDRYVVWNNVAEGPEFYGGRVATANYLSLYPQRQGDPEERLAYADKHGSSSHLGFDNWGDDYLIADQRGILRRPNYWEFCQRYFAGGGSCWELVEPFERDEEDAVDAVEQ